MSNHKAIDKETRINAALPEILELIERAGDIMIELESLLDTALLNDASAQKSQWHKDVAKLLDKIEGGGE